MNRFFSAVAAGAMLSTMVATADAGVLKRVWGEEFGATW